MLRLKLCRHFARRFAAQNLLAWNPAVVAHRVVPVRQHIDADGVVEMTHKQLMKALVPQETAREEGPRRDHCEQRGRWRAASATWRATCTKAA